MTENIHYTVEGQLMKMREMRQIVADVLGYGDAAYHLPVQDIVRLLRKDNRKVEAFKAAF